MVSKKQSIKTKIILSGTLFLVGFVMLTYWGLGMPYYVNAVVHFFREGFGFGDMLYLAAVGGIFVSAVAVALTIPQKNVHRGQVSWQELLPRLLCLVIVLGYCTAALTKYIPFPPDYPGCCMAGPSRHRGLPIVYEKKYSDFGQSLQDPPVQYARVKFHSGAYWWDIAIWTGTYAYIAYIWLLIRAHKHKK